MIDLEIREVRLPYRFRYAHARQRHCGLEAIVCLARDEEGRVGLGEAVPRTYVTGETCASVRTGILRLANMVDVNEDLGAASQRRVKLARDWRGPFPSCALCALDTALLDLRGRCERRSMAELLGAACPQTLTYTASVGAAGRAQVIALTTLYRLLGLKHFKVKVGDEHDVARVRLVRRMVGRRATLFADANGVWDAETAIRRINALDDFGVWAVEEPLRSPQTEATVDGQFDRAVLLGEEHYRRYRWLRDRSPIPLIADESLICWQTAQRIVEQKSFDIFNIRLSKCGGPLLAAEMARLAQRRGFQFALGAMVGETPILATAGAHFGAAHAERLYIQGYSHKLLHGRRFVSGEPALRRGRLKVTDDVAGLGLTLDPERLDAVTVHREQVTL